MAVCVCRVCFAEIERSFRDGWSVRLYDVKEKDVSLFIRFYIYCHTSEKARTRTSYSFVYTIIDIGFTLHVLTNVYNVCIEIS